jgi:hypothetical protein
MIDLRSAMARRAIAILGAGAALAGTSFGLVPAAAAPSDVPAVQSVALESSQTAVTSSSAHKLRVQVTANQTQPQVAGQPSSGLVTVTLSTGTSDKSEFHEWSFPGADGALSVDSTGAGKLTMTNPQIAPFGKMNLTITPVGDPTTQSCDGTPRSQTQKVSLDGTFFFDSMSSGKNAWGTVGQKSKSFTFAATNTVTTTYVNTNPTACLPDFGNLPCASSLFWQSTPNEGLSLSGVKVGTHGSIFASRTTDLSAPAGAKRIDEAFATSKKLVLTTSGTAASLPVKSDTNSAGSAKLSAKKHGKPFSTNCKKAGKSRVETSTTWNNAKYKNGSKPLAVHEQIYGAIKIANNRAAQITRTRIT